MAKKGTKKSTRKVESLKVKKISGDNARRVRGGASDIFAKIGDIKGELHRR